MGGTPWQLLSVVQRIFPLTGSMHSKLARSIKEAIFIHVNDPSLKENNGKYHLPHIWDEALFNTPELQPK